MIAYLRGVCHSLDGDSVVLDVHGVGYLVTVSDGDREVCAPGSDLELLIHTEVREDAFLLYGFRTTGGRDVFRTLIQVPGVGPKAAMALLSALAPAQLVRAVQTKDTALLCKAKGIGKKLADVIVAKINDRMPTVGDTPGQPVAATAVSRSPVHTDVVSALINLGFRPQSADQALAQALGQRPDAGFDDLLRSCLALLRRPG